MPHKPHFSAGEYGGEAAGAGTGVLAEHICAPKPKGLSVADALELPQSAGAVGRKAHGLDDLLTPEQMAAHLNVSVRWLSANTGRGRNQVPCIAYGAKVRRYHLRTVIATKLKHENFGLEFIRAVIGAGVESMGAEPA